MFRLQKFFLAIIFSTVVSTPAIALSPTRNALNQGSFATPSLRQPDYLSYYSDPVFGSRVYRVTGSPGTRSRGMRFAWSTDARHRYSKISPWNCNGSLALISNRGATNEKMFFNAKTMAPVYERRSPGTELRWLPNHPNAMFYTNGNRVGIWNVKTDSRETIFTFSGMNKVYIGPWEGNLSHRGHKVALMGDDGNSKWIIIFNIKNRKEVLRQRLDNSVVLDWLSISPSGKFLVINGKFTPGRGDQTKVYDMKMRELQFWPNYGAPSHYDLAFDERGIEVAIGVAKTGSNEGRVIKRELATGRTTALTPMGYASHTSARNTSRRGWVYVTYQGRNSWGPFGDEVVAVRTDGSMRFERIAQLRSVRSDYRAEAHAAPLRTHDVGDRVR